MKYRHVNLRIPLHDFKEIVTAAGKIGCSWTKYIRTAIRFFRTQPNQVEIMRDME